MKITLTGRIRCFFFFFFSLTWPSPTRPDRPHHIKELEWIPNSYQQSWPMQRSKEIIIFMNYKRRKDEGQLYQFWLLAPFRHVGAEVGLLSSSRANMYILWMLKLDLTRRTRSVRYCKVFLLLIFKCSLICFGFVIILIILIILI